MQGSVSEARQQQRRNHETQARTCAWSGRTGAAGAVAFELPSHDLPPGGQAFLDELLRVELLTPSAAGLFLEQTRDQHAEYADAERLGDALIRAGLLTTYQLDRVQAGTTHGLVLGNHRVLARLGAGAMGIVFLAEHALMKRRVAVKVLPVDDGCPPSLLERFYSEMRVLADLHHPHVVTAFDAGKLAPAGRGMPALLYLVMELVSGGDLEQYVHDHGPVPIAQACDWLRQAASGLQEAHDHHLIHRDVKPSNLLLTEQGQVKLVDFGLVREFCSQLTDPRGLLGTIEYMAPEQSRDPSAVGAEADIYGLGATLFWLLTGQTPYPPARSVAEALRLLQQGKPRRLRELRPDAPEGLEALISRMLEHDPGRRPSLPLTVMNALLPYTGQGAEEAAPAPAPAAAARPAEATLRNERLPRVLIVEDEPTIRTLSRTFLEGMGCHCDEAPDGATALAVVRSEVYDLVLLDLNLPDLDGYEVCRRLREEPCPPRLKIIIVSGRGDQNQLAESLLHGADDYVPKPFELRQLDAKVRHALRLKAAEERKDQFADKLRVTNRQLEQSLHVRVADVRQAHDAVLFTMARLAELRDGETPGHMRRLQLYTRALAEAAARAEPWAGLVDAKFLEQLECCVPLHDIGKIGLPDHVLSKPGKLDPEERKLVELHPLIGDQILDALRREHGESLAFLNMATGIVRHHHERYDGRGYPDRLTGDAIPAAARLVAVADVYDALRRERFHKLAWTHEDAAAFVLGGAGTHFDPTLVRAFRICQDDFERIYREVIE